MLLSARREEFGARSALERGLALADYNAELTDEALMATQEYLNKAEELKNKGGGGGYFDGNIYYSSEKQADAKELDDFLKDMRSRRIKEFKQAVSGQGGEQGVGESVIDAADFFKGG